MLGRKGEAKFEGDTRNARATEVMQYLIVNRGPLYTPKVPFVYTHRLGSGCGCSPLPLYADTRSPEGTRLWATVGACVESVERYEWS